MDQHVDMIQPLELDVRELQMRCGDLRETGRNTVVWSHLGIYPEKPNVQGWWFVSIVTLWRMLSPNLGVVG